MNFLFRWLPLLCICFIFLLSGSQDNPEISLRDRRWGSHSCCLGSYTEGCQIHSQESVWRVGNSYRRQSWLLNRWTKWKVSDNQDPLCDTRPSAESGEETREKNWFRLHHTGWDPRNYTRDGAYPCFAKGHNKQWCETQTGD